MVHPGERILIVGDRQHQLEGAVAAALPQARLTSVPNWFEGIAAMADRPWSAVLGAAEQIERRPEAAIRTARELCADARLVLFGDASLEPLSRKMLAFGCDDYILTPGDPAELGQILGRPMRIAPPPAGDPAPSVATAPALSPAAGLLGQLPLAEVVLTALHEHPHEATSAALRQINQLLGDAAQVHHITLAGQAVVPPAGSMTVSHALSGDQPELGQLQLTVRAGEDANAARHFLSRLCALMSRMHGLQDRHNRLQKLAITDELTGVHNARYFRHFLSRILERARIRRFPVTLLIIDIDNFKTYNDHYGHGVGDEILRQTAALMKRCCREHDLVARLGGDEFAVVFWEKEGPREPKQPHAGIFSRPPTDPIQILNRFRTLLSSQHFEGLGPAGKGTLTISSGLAIYPYDARTADELIEAADKALMFGAKRAGKNSIFLVGSDEAEAGE